MTVVKMLSITDTENILSKGKKPYKSWLKDGVNHGPSSMDVLVSWLAHKPNYKKWKREDYSIDRVPKKQLLEEIIDKLRQVGIYHRLAKDVASKISTLQSNYRSTRKWKETEAIKLRLDSKNIRGTKLDSICQAILAHALSFSMYRRTTKKISVLGRSTSCIWMSWLIREIQQ